MKPMFAPAILAALFAGSAVSAQDTRSDAQTEMTGETEGQIKLAKLLGNRVAGEPVSCIPAYGMRHMTVVDGTALVFHYGRTIYVNVPLDPGSLNDRDMMLTQRTSARMCSSDIVQTEDRLSGFYTGNIFLGEFVPFKRPASTNSN